MIKNLLITYLFLITNVFAGLPPTTVKGQAEAVKTTTFNVEVPYSQATTTAAGTRLLEVGNNNILANGSFEHSTYDTGWTCSLGTKTKETTTVFKGKNSMKIVSAGAGTRCYIYSTTDAAKLKGQQGHATVRVNSTDSVLQVCALAGGTTSAFDTNCVTVPVTTTEAPWKTIVIPTIMDGTGNGVVIKSAETLTKSVFIDEVEYKHGLPVQAVNGARLIGTLTYSQNSNCIWSTSSTSYVSYSADSDCLTPTATGEVIAPSTKIPGFQLNHKPGTYYIVVNGFFYQSGPANGAYYRLTDGTTPGQSQTCYGVGGCPMISGHFTYTTSGTRTIQIQGAAETASQVANVYTSGVNRDLSFSVYYFPPVSTIYSQASQDYDWTDSGLTTSTSGWQGFGTLSNVNIQMKRKGGDLYLRGTFTQGTPTSTEFRMPLPTVNGQQLTIKSGYIANSILGEFSFNQIFSNGQNNFIGASASLNSYLNFYYQSNTVGYTIANTTTPMPSSGATYYIEVGPIPIQGWQDYGVIVGSFEGIEKCANDYECTDKFTMSVSSSAVKSNENIPWATVASGGTGIYNITYNTNLKDGTSALSSPMNCTASALNDTNVVANIYSSTTTGVQVRIVVSNSAGANNDAFQIECQKGTNDYKPKTAKVASSIGVPTVPGVTTQAIESFIVSYGKTATTVCDGTGLINTNQCAYLDQIGNAVSSITRTTTATYALNTIKTYSKLKCTGSAGNATNFLAIGGTSSSMTCSNCNSLPFQTGTGPSTADAFGTLYCQGSY